MVRMFAQEYGADEEWLLSGKHEMSPAEALETFAVLVAQGVAPRAAYAQIVGQQPSAETQDRLEPAADELLEMLKAVAGRDLHSYSAEELMTYAAIAFRSLRSLAVSLHADRKTPPSNGRPALPPARTPP
jgi:hypothetical protein